jgi:hypothetical protein
MTHQFKIFEPSKFPIFTTNFFIYGYALVIGVLFFVEKVLFTEYELFVHLLPLGLMVLVFGLVLKILQHITMKHKKGKLNGEISFFEDKILVHKNEVKVSDLKSINILANDYEGKYIAPAFYDFNPAKSSGVNNFIELNFKNGSTQKIYFLQKEKCEIYAARDYLLYYYLEKKLSFDHLLEVLEMEDEGKIQRLKDTAAFYESRK